MKSFKKLVFAVLGGVFLFSCTAEPPPPTYSGPKLVLKEQVYDFQEVQEGQVLEHDFVVQNPGTQPLSIQDIKTG